jgi:LPS export ABC transporter protein LptC
LLVVLLAAGGWLLQRDFAARRRAEHIRPVIDVLPNVSQRIQNFHRVKVDNGRKVWEVSAREAQYLETEQMVVVEEPVVDVFLQDGRQVGLRGASGKLFLDGKELERVELQGEIAVMLGEYEMRTSEARYEADRGVIVAPGRVTITGSGFQLQGERMEVNVADQRLLLADSVQTTLWPRT